MLPYYRSAGFKCGPHCNATAVSQAWRINTDLAPLHHGTWRERKGLHMFIDLALAPQRMGMFGSCFWKETVMQLVVTNAAVFHVASAIGALREHLVRAADEQQNDKGTALAFGLRQCNKSIALLTQAAREGTEAYNDPGIALIVCVLFTIFEALYGDHGEALTHVHQGRKILWKCEQFPPGHGGSKVVDPVTARPALGGLQLQATCLSGRGVHEMVSQLDPLPLPDVTCIHSVEHANQILHVVYSNLLLYHQQLTFYVAGADASMSATQKSLRFLPWLKMWERGFAELLFKQSSSLRYEDMLKAKALKANHLLSTILAQVDTTSGWQAWKPFTAEFKAIIDLAAAVLSTTTPKPGDSPTDFLARVPCMSFGLWISEPLFVCTSRCTDEELRRQAAGLLNGIPRAQSAKGDAKSRSSAPSATSRSGTISRASSSSNERRDARRRTSSLARSGGLISRPPS